MQRAPQAGAWLRSVDDRRPAQDQRGRRVPIPGTRDRFPAQRHHRRRQWPGTGCAGSGREAVAGWSSRTCLMPSCRLAPGPASWAAAVHHAQRHAWYGCTASAGGTSAPARRHSDRPPPQPKEHGLSESPGSCAPPPSGSPQGMSAVSRPARRTSRAARTGGVDSALGDGRNNRLTRRASCRAVAGIVEQICGSPPR